MLSEFEDKATEFKRISHVVRQRPERGQPPQRERFIAWRVASGSQGCWGAVAPWLTWLRGDNHCSVSLHVDVGIGQTLLVEGRPGA